MDERQELVGRRREGRVLLLTLQREERRNAVDRALADALDEALGELDEDDELWAGVLAAQGPVFSAGSDLAAGGDYKTQRGGEYGIIRRERAKPLIAAVDGPALGGGFEIVLSCDLVVASSRASFGLPEVSIGVLATCAGLFRAPRALPLNVAKQLILTGERLSAERAYSLGLVNELTAPGEVLERSLALAERICENAPVSVRASLEAVNAIVGADDARGWAETEAALAKLVASEDAAEGIAAFFEKRAPVWRGR
jgi:enoyl-CoA hydratase/carnithine racemase